MVSDYHHSHDLISLLLYVEVFSTSRQWWLLFYPPSPPTRSEREKMFWMWKKCIEQTDKRKKMFISDVVSEGWRVKFSELRRFPQEILVSIFMFWLRNDGAIIIRAVSREKRKRIVVWWPIEVKHWRKKGHTRRNDLSCFKFHREKSNKFSWKLMCVDCWDILLPDRPLSLFRCPWTWLASFHVLNHNSQATTYN